MAIYPFILLHKAKLKSHTKLLNHERIHLRQQVEMLILPFYVWYLLEYLVCLIIYRDRNLAYRNISFEREAYANEGNLLYLKNRPFWKFLSYTLTE